LVFLHPLVFLNYRLSYFSPSKIFSLSKMFAGEKEERALPKRIKYQ